MFGELSKYENGTMYSIKNKSTKETEYYASKVEAETAMASGNYSKVKEESLTPKYILTVQDKLRIKAETQLKEAQTLVSSNQNAQAGDKFLEASYLVNALGGDSELFKYNAALSYHKGEAYQKAFDVYKELIEEGYTGETTSWSAVEKASGKEVSFNTKKDADTQAKLGLVSNIKEVKTPSVKRDLYAYTLMALNSLKKHDSLVEKIAKEFPNDSEIQTLSGNIYHQSGMESEFINKLLERTKAEPNNANNFYNLGVLYMQQNKDTEAIQYFEKAIQIKPDYKNAYTNLALLKIKPEAQYVEMINANLGKSAKEKEIYKEYTKKRKELYAEVIPYLEKSFQLDKTDYEVAKSLRQAYQAAEIFDKEDEMRAIEKSLKP
ncbi:MAG: tetratricopeptide repeat protein, partial [Lactovum sp.]